MSDPADKSDDLIAELAKLMAASPGRDASVQPVDKPAPNAPAPNASSPAPVRLPGMDAPSPSTPPPQPEARGPATGSIRIPGMDQPAPVSTSAPVSKFDFGKPVAAAPINREPLSSLSERLAAQDPIPPRGEAQPPAQAPARIPSSLTPVSENRSFAEGPSLSVAQPADGTAKPASPAGAPPSGTAPKPPSSDFNFDFGFAQNPPAPPEAPSSVQQPAAAAAPEEDPIAALIEADLAEDPVESGEAADAAPPPRPPPQSAAPVMRAVTPASAPARPGFTPVGNAGQRPQDHAPIPLKPVSAPQRPPESDRFAISPGVGLNMKPPAGQPLAPAARTPAPPAPADESDPMSEIESLIGEAVRVELSPGLVRVQTAQSVAPKVALEPDEEVEREIAQHDADPEPPPVVPPLTTQFAPRRANLKDDRGARSAEDAILAAAAASGSEVDRLEPSVGDESPYRRLKVRPQRSALLSGGVRQYVGMAVAGTLLLAAGFGLYWVLNMGRPANTGADAPQLTADATPVKAKPVETPKPPTDVAKSPVLAKMDGDSVPPGSEQLVSTAAPTAEVTRTVTPIVNDTESGLANRKVRTVTVRPDGTIVSGDDAVAGAEALPIDRPNVPSVPSAAGTDLLGNGEGATGPLVPDGSETADQTTPFAPGAAIDAGDTQVAEAEEPVIDPTLVAPIPMSFPVRSTPRQVASAPTNTSVNALIGAQTPDGQIDLLGGSANPIEPEPVVAAAPAADAGPNPAAYVQLSSQPSAADAARSIKIMNARYGSLFGGNELVVQQVDLGQIGMRWRVRLPAASLADASNICAQIKAQGGDCFATNS